MAISSGTPDGCTTLTPFLVCSPAAEALDFYGTVFGATVVSRMDGPGGTVPHAELDFGDGRLQLGDPSEEYGLAAPDPKPERVSASTCVHVPDVDAVVARAVAHGAVVREEPSTFVTGDRFASVIDPYGHRWAITTRVEDVSPEEAETHRQASPGAAAGRPRGRSARLSPACARTPRRASPGRGRLPGTRAPVQLMPIRRSAP